MTPERWERQRQAMRRKYAKLIRQTEQLAADPKGDPKLIENARKAIAEFEALPEHLR